MQPVFKQVLLDSIVESKAVSLDPDQPIKFIASTEAVDRYGDVVRASGWDLTNYSKNPIALFGHQHNAIVGQTRSWVEGKRLMSEVQLAEAGTGPIVDYVRALVRQKILRSVSVGFLPLEEPKYLRDEQNDRITGYEFTKQELLEISLVAVPANQEAIAVARSMSMPVELQRVLFSPAHGGALRTLRARVDLERLRSA